MDASTQLRDSYRTHVEKLGDLWTSASLSTERYLAEVEAIATAAHEAGNPDGTRNLAGVCMLRSARARQQGSDGDAIDHEVRALVLLGNAVEAGCDALLVAYLNLKQELGPEAVGIAECEMWLDRAEVEPQQEPETIFAIINRYGPQPGETVH